MNEVEASSIGSLQISGLGILFINACLEESGLYVTTEFKRHKVNNTTITNLKKYMDLAIDLLCFRDQCIDTSNNYDEHVISERDRKKSSSKRTIDDIQDDELSIKQESIRGTWNPPRSTKSPPPVSQRRVFFIFI
jgi:hypothetical protein